MGDKHTYNMTHKKRGVALIINNGKFHAPNFPNFPNYEEYGKKVMKTFEDLDFEVKDYMYTDVKADMMRQHITDVSRENHKDRDCFACVIITHGKEDVVYGTDGEKVDIGDLLQLFKTQKSSLLGKPKLFFIQACRGDKLEYGAPLGVEEDGSEAKVPRIPLEADFLVAYSTVKGFYSLGEEQKGGWWFISALCSILKEHGRSLDVMTMMTRVNREVAFEYELKNPDNPQYPGAKQVPCITSKLTKDVFFKEKKTNA